MTETETETATASATLTQQLAEFKAGFKQRAAPERVTMMEVATAELKASGIEARALKVGDAAPDLTLPDALGRPVRLREIWQRGPLVLIFYRGGWCPYCNLELRAWQKHLGALMQSGAGLVAVSPQTPDNSLSTAEKNELAYPVLSDSGLQAATAFGVAFEMPQPLIDLYRGVGNDLPVLNGNGRWVLPVPATYVIGRDGRIVFAHVEADYRERAEPADVMAAVELAIGTGTRTRDRVFKLTSFLQPSDAEPIRSVITQTPDAAVVAWFVQPGQRIAAHVHPHGQDTWTVISGHGDYQLNAQGQTARVAAGDVVVAPTGAVHGVLCTSAEPLVIVSVVSPAEAGYAAL